jgi:pSer/pThr/pTyr-binding forkhead associated (FHA) protein
LKVFPQRNDWYVEDLGSLNGSFLNGIRVSRSRIENDVTVKLDREGPSVRFVVVTAEKTALGSTRP